MKEQAVVTASSSGSRHEMRLPIEIRPNRGPSFVMAMFSLAVAATAMFIWYRRQASILDFTLLQSLGATPSMLGEAPFSVWGILICLLLFGAYGAVREYIYFRAGADHSLRLSAKKLELRTPFGTRAIDWQDVVGFDVDSHFSGKGGIVYTIDAIVRQDAPRGLRISVRQNDFARDLAIFRWSSAKALQRFLDEARRAILEAGQTNGRIALHVPKRLQVHEVRNMLESGQRQFAVTYVSRVFAKKPQAGGGSRDGKPRPTVVRD